MCGRSTSIRSCWSSSGSSASTTRSSCSTCWRALTCWRSSSPFSTISMMRAPINPGLGSCTLVSTDFIYMHIYGLFLIFYKILTPYSPFISLLFYVKSTTLLGDCRSNPVLRIRDVYPGSRILIFIHPGSRISDPKTAKKRGRGGNCCHTFFCSHKFHKLENYFIFEMPKKKSLASFQRIIELFTLKFVTKVSKTGFGIRVQWSKRRGSRIPDPQHWSNLVPIFAGRRVNNVIRTSRASPLSTSQQRNIITFGEGYQVDHYFNILWEFSLMFILQLKENWEKAQYTSSFKETV